MNLVSTEVEIVRAREDQMLTHSTTDLETVGSGKRGHFDDLAVDFIPSVSPEKLQRT